MEKIALVVIALVMMSGIAMSASDEKTAGASVEVNSYVSITLIDAGTEGINFDSVGLDPGTSDNPDIDQNSTDGAIKVRNDAVSNVNVGLYVEGTDFTGASGPITVDNVEYAKDSTKTTEATTLTTSYPGSEYYTGVTPGNSGDFWFFLDVPDNQTAGSYNSTFSFKGDTA